MNETSPTERFDLTPLANGRAQGRGRTILPAAVRIALLQQYGTSSQAYSAAFNAELEHFGDERGFLVYKRRGTTALVLSDPIAPPANVPDLISRFLKKHPDAQFWYLSPQVARLLAGRGFVRERVSRTRVTAPPPSWPSRPMRRGAAARS
jgi:lysylphosphatidylglycerol synthetase-like protein (DUF2156 family)